ncbi:MAG: 50S ribosomal protein L21 [Thermoleophilia bacterium]|nr:50S ribosomal protein L21 [Gaiellaceae bacterium]MDW8338030.1 50S ribosomal protein L21 [Thermoleophilia bacterium]
MTYAIIEVGGKQYRVREGQRLLVDRLRESEGTTFAPKVLFVGGDGGPLLDPRGGEVTAKVLAAVRGPKVRIGKYRRRTGYRRHAGFRASLTQIEIAAISSSGVPRRRTRLARAEAAPVAAQAGAAREGAETALPAGYGEMTVSDIKAALPSWSRAAVEAALAHEREHGKRKGALAALEAALAREDGGA